MRDTRRAERAMKLLRGLVALFACLAVVLAVAGCSKDSSHGDFQQDENENQSHDQDQDHDSPGLTIEQEILDLINAVRADAGLKPLARNSMMDALALQHSKDMNAARLLSHDGFQTRAKEIMGELAASHVGENVAVGYSSASAFVEGWLGSKGHRDNIMNPSFAWTGIGYFNGYATQIFCD